MATVWEITLKHPTGKLPLPTSPESWIEDQLCLQEIGVLPLQREVLYLAGKLPAVHKDPYDRVIAAETLHRDLRLLSPDALFAQYGCKALWQLCRQTARAFFGKDCQAKAAPGSARRCWIRRIRPVCCYAGRLSSNAHVFRRY